MAAVVGIERRLAHQPMHADLGLQPAVGVFALDFEGRRLDARDVAGTGFHQFGFPAAGFAPAQIHAQQHFRPILCLCAASAGLDVDVSIRGVQFAGEHALEFELVDAARVALDIRLDRQRGVVVFLHFDQFQELFRAGQAVFQIADAVDGLVEQRALATQRLRAFGVVPDIRIFQFAVDFFQTLGFGVIVKDTP